MEWAGAEFVGTNKTRMCFKISSRTCGFDAELVWIQERREHNRSCKKTSDPRVVTWDLGLGA